MSAFALELHLKSVDEFVNLKVSKTNEEFHAKTINDAFGIHEPDEDGDVPPPNTEKAQQWYGCENEAEARAIVGIGWPSGVERARLEIGTITMSRGQAQGLQKVRLEKKYGPDGDNFDMDRAHDEDASPWYSWVKESGAGSKGQHVRIRVALEASAWRTAKEMFFRGAALAMFSDALEESGRSVEIIGYMMTGGSYTTHQGKVLVTFPLKAAGEPLDLNRLAAITAFAGCFRLFGFQALASSENKLSCSYGHTIFEEKLPPFPGDADNLHTIDIRSVWSLSDAKRWLENEAARLSSGAPSTNSVEVPS